MSDDGLWAPLDFDEAIAWFGQKFPVLREHLDKVTWTQRKRAFWVSQAAQLSVVSHAMGALQKALDEGTTLEDFKKDAGPSLMSAWAGSVKNPGWRLEVIFRNNVQSAYAAGRYKQATDPDVLQDRPYWMFDATVDGRTTPICKAADGTVLAADDPWWRTHFPPCHHACRSHIITLGEDEAKELLGRKGGGYKAAGTLERAQEGWGSLPDDGEAIESWGRAKMADAGVLAAEAANKVQAMPAELATPPPAGGAAAAGGGGESGGGGRRRKKPPVASHEDEPLWTGGIGPEYELANRWQPGMVRSELASPLPPGKVPPWPMGSEHLPPGRDFWSDPTEPKLGENEIRAAHLLRKQGANLWPRRRGSDRTPDVAIGSNDEMAHVIDFKRETAGSDSHMKLVSMVWKSLGIQRRRDGRLVAEKPAQAPNIIIDASGARITRATADLVREHLRGAAHGRLDFLRIIGPDFDVTLHGF